MASGMPSRAAWVPTKKISSGSKAPSRFLNTAGGSPRTASGTPARASIHSRTAGSPGREGRRRRGSQASRASAWRPSARRAKASAPSARRCPSARARRSKSPRCQSVWTTPVGRWGSRRWASRWAASGGLEQARVAARVHEAREQLRVVARLPRPGAAGAPSRPAHGPSPTPGARRACGPAAARGLSSSARRSASSARAWWVANCGDLEVLADDAVRAPEAGPGRREAGILRHALEVEVPRHRQLDAVAGRPRCARR